MSYTEPGFPALIIGKEHTMNFEKLILSLEARPIQRTLREVDCQVLGYAICHESPEVQAKIFANMSARAAKMLKEDI
jgi:flagellar motor switch protein FliG